MKIRNGFVSNSSSSSFIVFGSPPLHRNYVELSGKIAENVSKRVGVEWDKKQRIFLTQFISDTDDYYWEIEEEGNNLRIYAEGNHGGPYWEENYVELLHEEWASVWILKKDYEDRDED